MPAVSVINNFQWFNPCGPLAQDFNCHSRVFLSKFCKRHPLGICKIMWLHIKVIFRDGVGIWTHDFAFWIPTVANVPPNLHIEMDCVFDPITLHFRMDARMTRRDDVETVATEPELA